MKEQYLICEFTDTLGISGNSSCRLSNVRVVDYTRWCLTERKGIHIETNNNQKQQFSPGLLVNGSTVAIIKSAKLLRWNGKELRIAQSSKSVK